MATVRIDIDQMRVLIKLIDNALWDGPEAAARLVSSLATVWLSAFGLSTWQSSGAAVAELASMRRDLQQRLDKAIEVNAMGVGGWSNVPATDLAFPEHTVVVFDDEPDVAWEDAKALSDWIEGVLSGRIDLSGGIPPELLDLLKTGCCDTAFSAWLAAHVSPAQLAELLNLIDIAWNELANSGVDHTVVDTFAAAYASLLDGLAAAYSKALNAMAPNSSQRADLIEAFAKVFRLADINTPYASLLSLLIARGDWPSDFLSAMKDAIETGEAAWGEGAASWWNSEGNQTRKIFDPAMKDPDGFPLEVSDPMFGVWMAAALHNPQWFIDQYCGHGQVGVDWGSGHGEVDQAIYDLFTGRGVDGASFYALMMAAGSADLFSLITGDVSADWVPFSSQVATMVAKLQADQAAYDALPFWDKYSHEILGMVAMLCGAVAMFTPAAAVAWTLLGISVAAGLADAAVYGVNGDWMSFWVTLGMVAAPFVISGVVVVVRFTVEMLQSLRATGFAMCKAFGVARIGGEVTFFVGKDWATLRAGSTVMVDGQRFALVGNKLLQVSAEEWASLRAGGRVAIGESRYFSIDGKLVEVTEEQWASMSRGSKVKIGNDTFAIVDGKPTRVEAPGIGAGDTAPLPGASPKTVDSADTAQTQKADTKKTASSSQTPGSNTGSKVPDWQPADLVENKGKPNLVVGKNDPIPTKVAAAAAERDKQLVNWRLAKAERAAKMDDFNNALTKFNTTHPDTQIKPVVERDLSRGNIDRTAKRLLNEIGQKDLGLAKQADDLLESADKVRALYYSETKAGEAFGEAAGEYVAKNNGESMLVSEASPGQGAVDQVWVNKDRTELILQECKSVEAKLGTKKVPNADGTTVVATQGSTAYAWRIIRQDTRIREVLMSESNQQLRDGLISGSVKIRYRLVQPDAAGRITVTEFIIDTSKLDITGWLS